MFVTRKDGSPDSYDITLLPGYSKLSEEQQRHIQEEFVRAYKVSLGLGSKIAEGKAYENARIAVMEELQSKSSSRPTQAPQSIFSGLDNF